MKNKYYLGILPQVYCARQSSILLLYNTKTGDFIKSDNISLIDIVEKMHEKKHLGVILFDDLLIEASTKLLIEECLQKHIFISYDFKEDEDYPKPVPLMPVLNLQNDVEKRKNGFSDKNLMENLLNVYVYLTGNCGQDCKHCGEYHKQTTFCTKSNDDFLEKSNLDRLLSQLPYSSMLKLYFLGGNILCYPYLDFLLEYLNSKELKAHFVFHYKHIDNENILDFFANQFIEIVFDEEIETDYFARNDNLIRRENLKFSFLVSSEEEYNNINSIIEEYDLRNTSVLPFYNGSNIDFFSENIYLNEADILSYDDDKQRYIFSHQKLNTNHFGTLYVLPSGDVRASFFTERLCNLAKDQLSDIVRKELFENSSWRKIRDQQPCCDCLYQYLCPSPSNYELAIGKPNLCKVK
jgi:pseudo-rSAM protein